MKSLTQGQQKSRRKLSPRKNRSRRWLAILKTLATVLLRPTTCNRTGQRSTKCFIILRFSFFKFRFSWYFRSNTCVVARCPQRIPLSKIFVNSFKIPKRFADVVRNHVFRAQRMLDYCTALNVQKRKRLLYIFLPAKNTDLAIRISFTYFTGIFKIFASDLSSIRR